MQMNDILAAASASSGATDSATSWACYARKRSSSHERAEANSWAASPRSPYYSLDRLVCHFLADSELRNFFACTDAGMDYNSDHCVIDDDRPR